MKCTYSGITNDFGSTGHARRVTEYPDESPSITIDRRLLVQRTATVTHSTRHLPYAPIANIHTNNTQFGRATYSTREWEVELRGKFPRKTRERTMIVTSRMTYRCFSAREKVDTHRALFEGAFSR